MSTVQHVTDSDFEKQVKQSDVPVLVDFWAPWCAPCRMIGPVMEELAQEYDGKAKVVKVNVDEEHQVAQSMGVRSIPTIALFDNGRVRDTFVGARSKSEFQRVLNKYTA